jgi:hypothetical protein
MSKINQTAVFAALDLYVYTTAVAADALVAALVDAGCPTREDLFPLVTEWVSGKCACPLVDGQKRSKGQKVFDSASPAYWNAQKTRQRILDAITPTEARAERAETAASAPTIKKATKAEREAHAALQAAREALQAAREAFLAACGGDKARAKALDKALSA